MPSETFQRSISVAASPAHAWDVLTDVARVASWVSIVEGLEELERLSRYSAVLRDQVGPFRLHADLAVRVSDVREGETVTLSASGEDRHVGSRITIRATLTLSPSIDGTSVAVSGNYEVIGRVASLGSGTIRRKADKALEQFFSNAQRELNA